jgi:hypothetical protein
MGTLLEYSKIRRAMKIAKDVRLVLFHLRGFDSVDALTAKLPVIISTFCHEC